MPDGRRRLGVLGALGALLCGAAIGLPSGAVGGGPAGQTLHLAQSGFGAERVKTIPITRRKGRKPRVVMSLPPAEVGDAGVDDSVWAGAEFEISVTCLEPIPQCVGKIYHYSPNYRARLVLAGGPKVTAGDKVMPLTDWRAQTCSQDLPHRNHHCVMALWGDRRITAPPVCQTCYVNLIVEAYHRQAKRGNVVVVGSDEDNGIVQDKGMLNAGVFKPGPPPAVNPLITRSRSRSKLGIGGPGSSGPKEVLYSQRINPDILRHEQLIVKAVATQKIGHLTFNVLMQSQLIVSDRPGSDRRAGIAAKVTSLGGVVSAQNGFNCTQGPSGHDDPCKIRKVGVVSLIKNAQTMPNRDLGPFVPLFVNLVVQNREIGIQGGWRPGDAARIPRRGGFIEVHRFGPEFHE